MSNFWKMFVFVQLSQPMGTEGGPTISRHFNNGKPGCLEATIKIGIDVTVFRLWVYENRYQLVAIEGKKNLFLRIA